MAHTSIKQLTEQIHFLVEHLTEKQLEEYLLFLESKENYGNKRQQHHFYPNSPQEKAGDNQLSQSGRTIDNHLQAHPQHYQRRWTR